MNGRPPCRTTPIASCTTHVGSLIRPPKLIEFWRAIEDGKPYDEAAFEACLTESVAEVVRQQAETGIDIVSDGEFSKGVNWAFYIFKRLSGITVRPATPEEIKDPMASMARRPRPRGVSRILCRVRRRLRASANGSATASSSTARSIFDADRFGATSAISRPASPKRKPQHPSLQAFCRWWRRRARCPAPRSSTTRTKRLF